MMKITVGIYWKSCLCKSPRLTIPGEYQPVYDEFGACFLFVHACVERFGLKSQDIASLSNNSFVAEMMISSTEALRHEELSQAQQGYLTDWARALFETEGISDELMAGCPPQEFYRIVGSLFRAIVTASRRGALSGDKLRNGLECTLFVFVSETLLKDGSASRTFPASCDSLRNSLAREGYLGACR